MKHMFRSAEGPLGIDHPLMRMWGVQESRKRARGGKPRQRTVECKFLLAEESFQCIAEFASEHLAQYPPGQKEAGPLGPNPSVAARGEAAGGHDAVDVRMVAPAPTIP